MVYHTSIDYSHRSVGRTTSLHVSSIQTKIDKIDGLALLAAMACRRPRMSKRSFDETVEIVTPLTPSLPLTAWHKKGPDPGTSSSMCSSKRLKGNYGGWSSGSTGSDDKDDEYASECRRNVGRKILPFPKGTKRPESVDLRGMFLKSLIHPAQFPAAKARKTDEERLHFLQLDPCIDVKSIGRQRVICKMCRSPVKLDSRRNAAYYPSMWLKHKKTCLEVYRAWLVENEYDDPTWIREAERRRDARLGMKEIVEERKEEAAKDGQNIAALYILQERVRARDGRGIGSVARALGGGTHVISLPQSTAIVVIPYVLVIVALPNQLAVSSRSMAVRASWDVEGIQGWRPIQIAT
ncbi:hypothetical protein DFS33DRAFT_1401495 [Desarmillaria ectypa]|nr:hypothetical protein DFS33DRAFT_1401495 [Desarmillaria ectypa]